MPRFDNPEAYVAFKVFRQTLTRLGEDTYQVVDRFLDTGGSKIVRSFTDAAKADAFTAELRAQRLQDVLSKKVN